MNKLTVSFDDETVDRLRKTAARLGRPQSQVVRDAVRQYAEAGDILSAGERQKKLDVMDRILARSPTRTATEIRAEIAAIRTSRRAGGRRHTADR